MLRPLRQTPANAPRPQNTDHAVLASAIVHRLAQVRAWIDDCGVTVTATDEQLTNCVIHALRTGGLDAFRAGVALNVGMNVPTNYALVKVLADIIQFVPEALRDETRLWVLAHGLRLPCKKGDEIEWLSPSGEPRAGKVIGTDNAFAACICEIASANGFPSGVAVRVLMESIYANCTQQRYDLETPVLGITYPDAPALAAANPGRGSETTLTGTSPGINLNEFDPQAYAAAKAAQTGGPDGPSFVA